MGKDAGPCSEGQQTIETLNFFGGWLEEQLLGTLQKLSELRLEKIRLADKNLVLSVGGYVGEYTRAEIECVQSKGKIFAGSRKAACFDSLEL